MVIGDEPPVALNPPVLEVTVYPVIAEPPFETGAVNVIVACPFPDVAEPMVGAPGTVAGVTEFEADEGVLVPMLLVAVTVNVYAVPLVRPVITVEVAAVVVLNPPTLDDTVYEVIALPPLFPGAVNVTVACPLPPVAVPMVGALGTVAGVTEFEAEEGELVPMLLVAVTVNVYAVPLVRPVMVIGEDPPVAVNPPTLEETV